MAKKSKAKKKPAKAKKKKAAPAKKGKVAKKKAAPKKAKKPAPKRKPAAICVIQPTFPAAITLGLVLSIFPTLRARNLFASSGCRML